ncbi:MAG TPA: DUF397 domain-containing protein [Streptosporangiaceae bacterium]
MDLSLVLWKKSSHSGNGGEDCIEVGVWRKSSRSGGNGGSCVEVAAASPEDSPLFLIRDSKDPAGPKLAFSASEWAAFLTEMKTGTLDLTR